ncbi:MAG: alpha/beta fold hydrolase [Cyanobacteria bacterium J06634_6]
MSDWLICPQRQVRAKLRLFCFAYAGGSAWIFRPWAKQLPANVEVCAIELPGRGKRLVEPALTDLNDIIRSLGPQLLPLLDLPFACFGHSMGALIAFELCRWLRRTVQLSPAHVWVSAARAPQLSIPPPLMHQLPKQDFINRLKQYQGTPISVLNNLELMDLMLPTLRADFTVLETYAYQPRAPFTFPVTGFWGEQDSIVSQADVAAWQVHTTQFELAAIAGDHFFMQQPQFLPKLLPTLSELVQCQQ